MHLAVYISDTPLTLKQSQSNQTENDKVDPKQGYKHAMLDRSCFNDVRKKANVKSFFKRGSTSITSLKHVRTSKRGWYIHDLLDALNRSWTTIQYMGSLIYMDARAFLILFGQTLISKHFVYLFIWKYVPKLLQLGRYMLIWCLFYV